MTEKSLDILKSVASADFIFTSKKEHKELAELGYVMVDGTYHDTGVGFMRKYATKITEAGMMFLEKELGNVVENNDIESVESITINKEKGAIMSETQFTFEPLVKATRNSSTRTSSYPFDAMPEPREDGQCATWYSEVGEDVVKKIQSAVGATNRKYSEPTGEVKISTKTGKEIPVLRPVRKYSVSIKHVPADATEFAGEAYAIVQRVM
jgi:hypothetical protein